MRKKVDSKTKSEIVLGNPRLSKITVADALEVHPRTISRMLKDKRLKGTTLKDIVDYLKEG